MSSNVRTETPFTFEFIDEDSQVLLGMSVQFKERVNE
jgi:hypothetical protein